MPITAFVLGDILQGLVDFFPVTGSKASVWLYAHGIKPYFAPYNASLIRAIIYVLLTWLPMVWLYKKKIYIKV